MNQQPLNICEICSEDCGPLGAKCSICGQFVCHSCSSELADGTEMCTRCANRLKRPAKYLEKDPFPPYQK